MEAGTPHASSVPSVCVIVLNYNGRELLERFLPLIAKTDYQPLELVVVDNASTDDSCEWLRAHWPQVTLLRQERNLGYAGGNNAGIRYAIANPPPYVAIANNDIEPHPLWVREAVAHAAAHPEHGIIGFRLFNQDASRPAFELACRQARETTWRPAAVVTGCALFCDLGVLRAVGLFDEAYQFYAEEEDLEQRAMRAGWQMAELSVPVWHLGEASTQKMGLRRAYLVMRNVIRLHLKLRGILAGLRMSKTVLNRACNPWLKLDLDGDYTLRRYRPAGLATNAMLACAAIGWNLLWLPRTLAAGRRDRERIARYRASQSL
ncbi:MAG: glycosyltransferase family 2 protein [Verrucomicrobiae bacterium]|nr:glycosyltransferase family 2 protein [Verrucomicrobiae bacterium]